MKNFYSLLTLMFIGTSALSAQTFPCGSSTLSDCYCLGNGTLVADSEPCSFDSGTSQQVFVLVDVNDATVDGDADDDAIVSVSTSGTFTNVPTGDYVTYQLVYDNADESTVSMLLDEGDAIADLTAQFGEGLTASDLATVNGPDCDCPEYNNVGNIADNKDGIGVPGAIIVVLDADGNPVLDANGNPITTTTDQNGNFGFADLPDGDYTYGVTYPTGYSGPSTISVSIAGGTSAPTSGTSDFDETVCDSFVATASVLCQGAGAGYKVVVTIEFIDFDVTNGFMVTSNHPGGFNGVTYGSFIDGAFADGTGFSYTITSLDAPSCSANIVANAIDCSSVAIELVRFEATATTEGNEVSWETASEDNNNYFTVEYSIDGINFKPIAQVNSVGNTSTGSSYAYTHTAYETSVSYYRLSQTDLDGTTKYVGNVARVERAAETLTLTNVFPVPASEIINLEFMAVKAGNAIVNIYDLSGKLVNTANVNTTAGMNAANFDISGLATGTYFVSITSAGQQTTAKFVKN